MQSCLDTYARGPHALDRSLGVRIYYYYHAGLEDLDKLAQKVESYPSHLRVSLHDSISIQSVDRISSAPYVARSLLSAL